VDYLVTYYGQVLAACFIFHRKMHYRSVGCVWLTSVPLRLRQELCVASKIESLKAYVTGKVEQEQLQAATFKFINRCLFISRAFYVESLSARSYVMCSSCNNPETTPSVCGSKKKQCVLPLLLFLFFAAAFA
jgi:hypothetical protein